MHALDDAGSRGPVVFLILSHKAPELLERLVNRLGQTRSAVTVIHHDSKAGRVPSLAGVGRSVLLPDPLDVRWGEAVDPTIHGLRYARAEVPDFSWIVVISGQDYPVMTPRAIEAELAASRADAMLRWEPVPPFVRGHNTDWQRGASHRYYWHLFPRTHRPIPVPRLRTLVDGLIVHAGSNWLNLGPRAVGRILDDPEMLTRVTRRFATTLVPDEGFFQTMLLNAPTRLNLVCENRRFIRFPTTGTAAHPDILTAVDFDVLKASGAFFARKVDLETSAELLDRLDRE